jgi:alpha-ketoglutarate-dependent taurine dioxygenase
MGSGKATDIISEVDGVEVLFTPIDLPGQRVVHGNVFPLTLQVSKISGNEEISVEEASKAVRDIAERGIITDLTNRHGAVIFRQPHSSARAFSQLVHAAEEGRGHKPYDQVGLAGNRTVHDKEVFSASEAPQNVWIYHHNEYSRYTKFPSNIHFFCSQAAEEGGESPIAHSAEFFDRINEEMPEFVKEVSEKGIISPDNYKAPAKGAKDFGFTWAGPLSFGHEIQPDDDLATMKKKAEKQAARLTSHISWGDDNTLQLKQYVPAIRRHPATKKPVFFNSIAGRYGNAVNAGATDPPYKGNFASLGMVSFPPETYGDGSIIPKKYLQRIFEISQEIQVLVAAQPGDFFIVDNYQVSHARAPWTKGTRKILVSMWDTDIPAEQILAF